MALYDPNLDSLLDEIEAVALRLAARHRLLGVNITRWRWDEPDITLSWLDQATNKSLHVQIVDPAHVVVEVNAWKDFDYQDGKKRKRIWNEKRIGEVTAMETSCLEKFLGEAIAVARAWKEADLHQVAHIA